MNALIEQFRKELSEIALYADDTVSNYISCLYQFSAFVSDSVHLKLQQTTPMLLRNWMCHLKEKNISNSRLTHHQSALKQFFSFMIKMKIIEHNPADGLFQIRRVKSTLNQPIDKNTAYILLKSVDRSSWLGQRNFMILSFLWALGLRRRELTEIKIKDFNPDYDKENNIGLLTIHGKGNKQRALFVVDKLYDNLAAYLSHPQSPKQGYKPMFPGKYGNKLSGDHVLKIVRQAAKKAGLNQRITPHVLRHSFATEMYLAAVPLEHVQDLMGHETEAETAIYIHISEQMQRQALQQIAIDGDFSWPFLYGGAARLTC